jgi:hypothetical protein
VADLNRDRPAPARSGFGRVLLLGALFGAPLIAALLLYRSGWKPASGIEHGTLLDPPRPLPEVALARPDGSLAPPDALRGAWTLIYLGDGACDSRCMNTLADLRQVRLALDKDASRVRRVFLYTGHCCREGFPGPGERDLLVLNADGPSGAELLGRFPPPATGGDGLYVIDPLGNLILGYPAAGAARGLLADLERLLRLSQIG